MKTQFVEAREFVRGAARLYDLIYVISRGKMLIAQDIAHTSLIAIDQGRWADAANTEWDSTAIAIARLPAERAILVGEDGDVLVYLGGGRSTREKISPDPIMIRFAHTIDGYVFACGMKRQVFKRIDEEKWIDISAPFPDSKEKVGFEGIDGFSDREIYAVGWKGEIWEYNGSKWINRGSPTNLILNAVCCAPDHTVYTCGQQGIMIKGRNDSWEIIECENEVSKDLWDLCWFQGKLYVATITGLYTLEENQLVEVDFGEMEIPTCYSLTAADGVLWSIGKDDVVSFDGKVWQRYD